MAANRSKPFGWAEDLPSAPVEDVGVDHRRGDIAMPEKFLDGKDTAPPGPGTNKIPKRAQHVRPAPTGPAHASGRGLL